MHEHHGITTKFNSNVAGDLICGEDLVILLAAVEGGNAELEIQCCDKGKEYSCSYGHGFILLCT